MLPRFSGKASGIYDLCLLGDDTVLGVGSVDEDHEGANRGDLRQYGVVRVCWAYETHSAYKGTIETAEAAHAAYMKACPV